MSKITPNSLINKSLSKKNNLDFCFILNLKIAFLNWILNKYIIGLFALILDKFCPKVMKDTEHSLSERKIQIARTRHSPQITKKQKIFYLKVFNISVITLEILEKVSEQQGLSDLERTRVVFKNGLSLEVSPLILR